MIISAFNPEPFGCLLSAPSESAKPIQHRNVGSGDVAEEDASGTTNAVHHLLPQPLVQVKKWEAVFTCFNEGIYFLFTSFPMLFSFYILLGLRFAACILMQA